MIWEPDTIRAVGESYRTIAPEERREDVLVKLLSEQPSALEEKIKDDFRKGDMVLVDGWILSKTEARQCALFSLQ